MPNFISWHAHLYKWNYNNAIHFIEILICSLSNSWLIFKEMLCLFRWPVLDLT